ncbi:hypothetical protein Y032_0124g1227 [Ancylostoma ceylanicum]|nr:hypothetical protein Y032_0124g1227 [Ancylostoma ceylanicum]
MGVKKGTPMPMNGAFHYPIATMLYKPGLLLTIFSAVFISFPIVFAFGDSPSWDRSTDNVTRFVEENREAIRNGTWNYSKNRTYGIISARAVDPWLENMRKGMYRYNFGKSQDNFCWKRQNPSTDEVPSIFRASQLFATVQVPIRTVFLMSLTYRSFLLFATLYDRSVRKSMPLVVPAVSLAVINELFHLLSLFTAFTFHIWQDNKYPRAADIAMAAALVSFAVKMIQLILLKGKSTNTVIRIVFLIAALLVCQKIVDNSRNFIEYVSCDQNVAVPVAIAEYAFFAMEFASYLLDVVDASKVAIFVHCAAEDFQTYDITF